jgi:Mg-chelatase subunit ChlD
MSDKGRSLQITIGKGEAKQVIARGGPEVKVHGETASVSRDRGVDLVFVIDTTGSMDDKIDGLLETCAEFAEELGKLNLDQRMAVISFGDLYVPGDRIEAIPFTEKVSVIKDSLRRIPRNSGGGNEGESSLEAIERALALGFRQDTVKTFILITDEPAHQRNIRAEETTRRLIEKEVLTFVVSPPFRYFKEMAEKTGGIWFQVATDTDFKSILGIFRDLVKVVSAIVTDVHQLGKGSVAKYLKLKAGR